MPLENLSSTETEKTEEEKKQEEKLKGFYICQASDELTEKTKKALLDLTNFTNIQEERHKIKNNLKDEFAKRTQLDRKELDFDGENKRSMFGTDEQHLLMTEDSNGLLDFKNEGKFQSTAVVQRKGDDGKLIDSYDIITYNEEGEISAFIEGEYGTSRLKRIDSFRNIVQINTQNIGNSMETQTNSESQQESNAILSSGQYPQRIAVLNDPVANSQTIAQKAIIEPQQSAMQAQVVEENQKSYITASDQKKEEIPQGFLTAAAAAVRSALAGLYNSTISYFNSAPENDKDNTESLTLLTNNSDAKAVSKAIGSLLQIKPALTKVQDDVENGKKVPVKEIADAFNQVRPGATPPMNTNKGHGHGIE